MKSLRVTIQMKATEQYFPVVLFIMLYKVVLTFESVDEILKCTTIKSKLLGSNLLQTPVLIFLFQNFCKMKFLIVFCFWPFHLSFLAYFIFLANIMSNF